MSVVRAPGDIFAFAGSRISTWTAPAGGASIGGDWLDILPRARGVVCLSVGDVEGHGYPAAACVEHMRAAIARANDDISPAAVLAVANEAAIVTGKSVTSLYGRLDRDLRVITFANAGHPAPLLVTRTETRFLEPAHANLPLGLFPEYAALEQTYAIAEDALFVMYTDGVTEVDRDPIRGERALAVAARRAFADSRGNCARAISEEIVGTGPSRDDAAILAIRFRPESPLRSTREAAGEQLTALLRASGHRMRAR